LDLVSGEHYALQYKSIHFYEDMRENDLYIFVPSDFHNCRLTSNLISQLLVSRVLSLQI